MKKKDFWKTGTIAVLIASMGLLPSCKVWNSMSQTGQGAAAGGTIGAAVGTGVGALIGGGKGTWIGALVGSALGAGTGALVGNQMDKQKNALQAQIDQLKDSQAASQAQLDSIKIQMVKDRNDLDAIKIEMGSSVLFKTNSSALSPVAQAALSKIAYNLGEFPNTDITVVGYTDNTGTAAINNPLSLQRAESVATYLENHGVSASRVQAVGEGDKDPIASNATAAGRAQNRRVEIYITADKNMIESASR